MKALFLDALRGLRSRSAATAVALGGLMLAQAACLLVALLAIALSDPDPGIQAPERVVVLDFKGNLPGESNFWFTAAPLSFADMLKRRQLPLERISRVAQGGLDIKIEGRLQASYLLMADPDIAPLLNLKPLAGDLPASLARPDGIAINTDLLRKLWGDLPPAQAMGRSIEGEGRLYTVGAVLPELDPRNPLANVGALPSVGRAMAMVGYDSQANTRRPEQREAIFIINGRVFARLGAGASVDQVGGWMREAFEANPLYAKLPAEWTAKGRQAAFFRGLPLTQLPFEGDAGVLRWQLLGAVGAACALLLLLAAFNTMNLQTASLLQRQRETALRRSLGADGPRLLQLWGLEVLLPLLLAAAGACLLAWCLAPALAAWIGLDPLHPVADPMPPRALLGLGLSVLLLLPLTLALPAWAALRRAPAPALQGRNASEGPWGRRLRQLLLTLQLSGSILLLGLAGVLALQQQYLLNLERGFDTHNRFWLGLVINPKDVPNLEPLIAALRQHPAIQHWAFSEMRPARDTMGERDPHLSASGHKQTLRVSRVSASFFDTYGMSVLAGDPRMGAGAEGETRLVIDAKAARLLGFATPQAAVGALLNGGGEWLQPGTEARRVIAVVKDVRLESAREPALPQGFLISEAPQWDLSVYGPDAVALRRALDEIWAAHGPAVRHEIQSADAQLAEVYQQEQQITTLLAGIALLAVGVTMLGAYALVADTMRRRRTELVLRRLHGASDMQIAAQLAREFVPPLLAAALLALPLAAWLAWLYLQGFDARVAWLDGLLLPLAAACVLTLVITLLATVRHLRQALALRPVEALG
ncbi:cell division protein FtsX [Paucibacter oligotrophus]|uniref:Cell division protein FtsX n=1 Tax=Roseateles oligotrophus TaxID=1769250 RepID=A0A840LB74_9BURK|nr:FtsX-like permease family protein [Roseateles oligotrophus]MBB4842597.1 cell division protein FtsX [Roseateles oligotrophus]